MNCRTEPLPGRAAARQSRCADRRRRLHSLPRGAGANPRGQRAQFTSVSQATGTGASAAGVRAHWCSLFSSRQSRRVATATHRTCWGVAHASARLARPASWLATRLSPMGGSRSQPQVPRSRVSTGPGSRRQPRNRTDLKPRQKCGVIGSLRASSSATWVQQSAPGAPFNDPSPSPRRCRPRWRSRLPSSRLQEQWEIREPVCRRA